MSKPLLSSTPERIRFTQFRQALYDHGFTFARDALFEEVDALLLGPPLGSLAELSLVPVFRRQWPSLYAALAEGRVDRRWLERTLLQLVPPADVLLGALDSTVWPHAQAKTLPARQYYPVAGKGPGVVAGHAYSLLSFVAQRGTSWALPLLTDRVTPAHTAVEVGVAQVKRLCQEALCAPVAARLVIAADGSYGNHRFLGPLRQEPVTLVARMRRDRVLFREPGDYGGRGRPRKHGERFAFKEPESWGAPDEEVTLSDERWGQVRLRRWKGLHEQKDAGGKLCVVVVESHRERERPPEPLWLCAQRAQDVSAVQIWRWYDQRWPMEPSIRFRKQALAWTTPRLRDPAACDRWTDLVTIAQWELYLARECVRDRPRPWEAAQVEKTPARVKGGLGALFAVIGTPAREPQTRGKAPGWPKGRVRTRAARHPVVRKSRVRVKKKRPAAVAA